MATAAKRRAGPNTCCPNAGYVSRRRVVSLRWRSLIGGVRIDALSFSCNSAQDAEQLSTFSWQLSARFEGASRKNCLANLAWADLPLPGRKRTAVQILSMFSAVKTVLRRWADRSAFNKAFAYSRPPEQNWYRVARTLANRGEPGKCEMLRTRREHKPWCPRLVANCTVRSCVRNAKTTRESCCDSISWS